MPANCRAQQERRSCAARLSGCRRSSSRRLSPELHAPIERLDFDRRIGLPRHIYAGSLDCSGEETMRKIYRKRYCSSDALQVLDDHAELTTSHYPPQSHVCSPSSGMRLNRSSASRGLHGRHRRNTRTRICSQNAPTRQGHLVVVLGHLTARDPRETVAASAPCTTSIAPHLEEHRQQRRCAVAHRGVSEVVPETR